MRSFDKMKIFRFFLPSFFWLSLLIVPLGMSYFFPVASPFVLVKSVWLEILAAATMLALLPFIFEHNQKSSLFLTSSLWRRSVLPVWIFWLAWSLLSIFSVYPLQSWLGSYLRQTGLLFYFWLAFWYSFVVYYFGGFYRTDNSFSFWKKGAGLSAFLMGIAGTIAGVYAFLQFCGYDFAVWQESQLYGRAIGTLGQPNFLGSFLLATLAMTAYTFFSVSNIRWKIFSVFMFVCQLAGLVLSGSRSAWLAFIVVLVFLFLLFSWRRWRWRALLASVIVSVFFIGILFFVMPVRMNALFDSGYGSIALRRYFYQSAWSAIEERPFFGVGLENGGEVFAAGYQANWGTLMNIDSYTDKAHNNILDIIVQTGLVGFIFWAGLNIFLFGQCYLLWRRRETRAFAVAALSALAAYGISLLFGISDISGVFYFWVIAALAVAGNSSFSRDSHRPGWLQARLIFVKIFLKTKKKILSLSIKAGALLLATIAVGQIYFSFSSLLADYYWLQIYRLLPSRQYFTVDVLWSYLDENALNPIAKHYYQVNLAAYALSDFDYLPDLASQALLRRNLKIILADLPVKNYDFRVMRARLSCFFRGAEAAESLFADLMAFSPSRPAVYRNYAACLRGAGLDEQALSVYRQALALLPARSNFLFNDEHQSYSDFYASQIYVEIALIQERLSDWPGAAESWRLASFYQPDNFSIGQRLVDAYLKQGKDDNALLILEHYWRRQPDIVLWPSLISEIYASKHDSEQAEIWRRRSSILN